MSTYLEQEEARAKDLQLRVRRALKDAGLKCRTSRSRYGCSVQHFDAGKDWTLVAPALMAAGFRVGHLNGTMASGPYLLVNDPKEAS